MTEPSNPFVIEKIEPRTWALHVRDTRSDEIHELELRGRGPWKIDLDGKAVIESGKAQKQVVAPPDDAITLRLQRADGQVRVAAVGRGAKAWTASQATLIGSKWFLDSTGAPVALLEDRPTLVDEIRAAHPAVGLDLSKYTAEPAPRQVAPDAAPAPSPAAPAPLKKSRRGFGGKVKVPQDTDIELRLSNVGRTDSRVGVVAVGHSGEADADEVLAWVQQRGASLGPWQPQGKGQVTLVPDGDAMPEELMRTFPDVHLNVKMYQRPGITMPNRQAPWSFESMLFPKTEGPTGREEPHMVESLSETIRRLSEEFIVIPKIAGHGFRAVELRNDRSTGVYEGLPIGTFLLEARLDYSTPLRPIEKHWEPLKQTLRALKRPAVQFDMLREAVVKALKVAHYKPTKREVQAADVQPAVPVPASQGELAAPVPGEQGEKAAAPAERTSPTRSRGRKKEKPQPGPGAGGLTWEPTQDGDAEGLAAPWGEGRFKLLHLGGDRYGLFYEHNSGGYETLLCGTLDQGKEAAGERAAGRPTVDLKAAQVACAGTRRSGPPNNSEITLHLRSMEGQRPDLMIVAKGERVHEWVFGHSSVLGHTRERSGEDNFPMAILFDKPTVISELRKEFPGVNIDTSDYKKPKADAPAAEPAATEAAAATNPSAPTPAAAPPADDANQDAELLRSIKSQLADMLDEED
jgi:hypothetical protein